MKKIMFLLFAATIFLNAAQCQTATETATITSAETVKGQNKICWTFTAVAPVNGVWLQVKIGDNWKPVVGTDGKNKYAYGMTSGSACTTDAYKPAKGRTYRLYVSYNDPTKGKDFWSEPVTAQ